MRLIPALFTGPFWVQLLAAAACLWLGQIVRDDIAARQATLADMVRKDAPAPTPIDGYAAPDPRPQIHEVALSVQIDPRQIVPLPEQSSLIPIPVIPSSLIPAAGRHLVVLFAPSDGQGTTTVQGAMVLTAAQRAGFDIWIAAQTTSKGALGPILTVNGLQRAPAHAALVTRTLADMGLTKAERFVDLAPFLGPRAEGLSAAGRVAPWVEWGAFGMAGAMVLLALVNLRRRSGRARSRPVAEGAAPPAAPALAAKPAPSASAQPPAGASYDPLRAISQRKVLGHAEPVAAAAFDSPAPARSARLPSLRLVGALAGVGLIGLGAVSMLDKPAPVSPLAQPAAPSAPVPPARLIMVTLADAPLPAVVLDVTSPPAAPPAPGQASAPPVAEPTDILLAAEARPPASSLALPQAKMPASPAAVPAPASATAPAPDAAPTPTSQPTAPSARGPALADQTQATAVAMPLPPAAANLDRAIAAAAATPDTAPTSSAPTVAQADLPDATAPIKEIAAQSAANPEGLARGWSVLLVLVLGMVGLVLGLVMLLPRRFPQLAALIPTAPKRTSGRLAEDPFDRLAARLAAELAAELNAERARA